MTQKTINPLLAAVLSGLVVGVPAGYMLTGVVGGQPPVARAAIAAPTPAPSPTAMHASMHHAAAPSSGTPATRAFREASARMHADMGDSYTGDVDLDFARGMIPHHQGAIDMARIELEHGTDPKMRKLAESVVRDQEREIALMHEWAGGREAAR